MSAKSQQDYFTIKPERNFKSLNMKHNHWCHENFTQLKIRKKPPTFLQRMCYMLWDS